MSALRDSGSARLTLTSPAAPRAASDELLAAVRQTAGNAYEVFGEIGQNAGGFAFLARDRQDKKLVALRLTRGGPDEYLLEVAKQLDATLPAAGSECSRCRTALRSWGRYCTKCGLDQWTDSAGPSGSPESLLEAVQQAAAGKFEVLGEMSRAQGGGMVYFARDLATGKIEALRLLRERDQDFSIGVTNILRRALSSPDEQTPPQPRKRSK